MKTRAIVCLLALSLAGCAGPKGIADTAQTRIGSAQAAPTNACRRGTTEQGRSFVFCEGRERSLSDYAAAIELPMDWRLELSSILQSFGVSKESMKGISAATYSQIVPRIAEVPTRARRAETARRGGKLVVIGGMMFRKYLLAGAKREAVLLIEA